MQHVAEKDDGGPQKRRVGPWKDRREDWGGKDEKEGGPTLLYFSLYFSPPTTVHWGVQLGEYSLGSILPNTFPWEHVFEVIITSSLFGAFFFCPITLYSSLKRESNIGVANQLYLV